MPYTHLPFPHTKIAPPTIITSYRQKCYSLSPLFSFITVLILIFYHKMHIFSMFGCSMFISLSLLFFPY
nr:MAG TPA: hypothetical protein [Caudoviricetes sp.]